MFDEMYERIAPAPDVAFEPDNVGGVAGWWCRPADAPAGCAILYFHGGGYVAGSAQATRHFASHVAARSGVALYLADYRLAPEHPFPAAVDDARAASVGLTNAGYEAVALAGASAGGGLALALAGAADTALARARAVAVISPWTDLALTGARFDDRADADPVLTKRSLANAARLYLGAADPRSPLASPLFGNVDGLPPLLVQVGEDEILYDDAARYAERVARAGGMVEARAWEGMAHVFQTGIGRFAAADDAMDRFATFLRTRLA